MAYFCFLCNTKCNTNFKLKVLLQQKATKNNSANAYISTSTNFMLDILAPVCYTIDSQRKKVTEGENMKYNLSNIMKRAWMLVKKSGLNISAALKKAWKEAKEITMKGTEKQIAYATKLLENMNVHFNSLIAACPDNKKSVWVNLLDGINAIAAESYAGDVIDALRIFDVDYAEYYRSFYYNVKSGRDSFSKNVMALLSKLA